MFIGGRFVSETESTFKEVEFEDVIHVEYAGMEVGVMVELEAVSVKSSEDMFKAFEEIEVLATTTLGAMMILVVGGTSKDEGLIAVLLFITLIRDDVIAMLVLLLEVSPMMGVVALQTAKARTSSSLVLHFRSALSNTIVVRVVK